MPKLSNASTKSRGTRANKSNSRSAPTDFIKAFSRASKIAVREAIAMHHAAGDPVVVEKDGKLVNFMPDGSFQPLKKRRSPRAA